MPYRETGVPDVADEVRLTASLRLKWHWRFGWCYFSSVHNSNEDPEIGTLSFMNPNKFC
jgi:hypothetical protein